jgi:hypothetical protein
MSRVLICGRTRTTWRNGTEPFGALFATPLLVSTGVYRNSQFTHIVAHQLGNSQINKNTRHGEPLAACAGAPLAMSRDFLRCSAEPCKNRGA